VAGGAARAGVSGSADSLLKFGNAGPFVSVHFE
jgi:hypothetical protein